MEIIDVHCHLEAQEFSNDLDIVLDDAKKIGIIKLITSSVEPSQWDKSLELSQKYPEIECTWGIHPWYIKEEFFDDLNRLTSDSVEKIVAIGEIGLDLKIDTPSYDLQEKFFIRQLEIAKEINIPVVIHCRGAFSQLTGIVKKIGMPQKGGIIHAFKGSVEIVEQLLPLGFYFSFGCGITYRYSKKRQHVLNTIYPERILIETDSPDIPPAGKSDTRNIPSNITLVIKNLTEYLKCSENEIASQTTKNAKKIFNL
ncbi:MAG TPA: TatD family hydrolase [Candidatus Hydrogenedens sp.]|nr:TatD family hydrolase [Candidatus Hydrogenedens sp.]HOK08845.1 TatD family hydrolase [Candidatus Hydrogenedens sp.]HOL18669.1 TatD family hydrolase [Candidatus Hydrogenedens sp.]HPP58534.1 TatD family hydrolase [Candidatus Hydrogenedens sp.]